MKTKQIILIIGASLLCACVSTQPHSSSSTTSAQPVVVSKDVQCVHVTVKVVGASGEPLDGYLARIDTINNGSLADYHPLPHGKRVFSIGRYDDKGMVTLLGRAPSNNQPPKVGVLCQQPVRNYSHNMTVRFKIPCQ